MEGSREPGDDSPRSLGPEWGGSWGAVAQQHCYPATSRFWGVVDFPYLPSLVGFGLIFWRWDRGEE